MAGLATFLRGALSNCGGINLRPRRFAGRLAEPPFSEEELLGVLHSLILRSGVRKTTARGRNAAVVKKLVADGVLGPPRSWRVLEVGASAGLDALSTRPVLEQHGGLQRYVLGDMCTHVLYDRERGLVFDEDGALLQARVPGGFVSMAFSYNYGFQRLTSLPKKVLPLVIEATHAPLDRDRASRIPLVHPGVELGGSSPFELRRLDVFDPGLGDALGGAAFDLIVCMHLLVPRYFDEATRRRGVDNLKRLLAPDGRLIVGATEAFRVVKRERDDTFTEVAGS